MSVDDEFEAIDQVIEALEDERDTCRRAIVVSRAAIGLGLLTLVCAFTVITELRSPTVVFGAIAAVIGGTVWFGANKSSREEIDARLAAVNARKARLFDVIAARNGWRDITTTIH